MSALEKNGKTWADKQLKVSDVEDAIVSYQAAMRYAGSGSAGEKQRKKIATAMEKVEPKI